MRDDQFIQEVLYLINELAADRSDLGSPIHQEEQMKLDKIFRKMFTLTSKYNEWLQQAPTSTRDRHVGESDYSKNDIQPWDIWLEYALNPWDADLVKRIIRTKAVPGLTPSAARIQDYEKVKHICDERIDQINAGDPYYQNFKLPPWIENE